MRNFFFFHLDFHSLLVILGGGNLYGSRLFSFSHPLLPAILLASRMLESSSVLAASRPGEHVSAGFPAPRMDYHGTVGTGKMGGETNEGRGEEQRKNLLPPLTCHRVNLEEGTGVRKGRNIVCW